MSNGYKKVKKIGDCKSACDYSCFNGKQVPGRVHAKVWITTKKEKNAVWKIKVPTLCTYIFLLCFKVKVKYSNYNMPTGS